MEKNDSWYIKTLLKNQAGIKMGHKKKQKNFLNVFSSREDDF